MADYKKIIPFILKWEGGLSKNKDDVYAKNPVPNGTGYHTNKGITWVVFSSYFGNTTATQERFMKMSSEDWGIIFKHLFWDAIKGDNIQSQKVADILVNWAWGSGVRIPSVQIQQIVGVTADGNIGPKTIAAINAMDEKDLVTKLKQKNISFYEVLTTNPKYSMFRKGWFNRLNDLYDKYLTK